MTTRWQAVLLQCKHEPRIVPILLTLFRIAICFFPQTGYLHPDEFFQSTDIVAANYFHSKTQPAWEFTTDKPIRCMLIPSSLNYIAFKIVSIIQNQQPSAYSLLVAPRVAYTLLSYVVDYCLYKLCQYHSARGLWYLPVSIIFQTSFVCISCMTRTLSNVPEVVIFGLLLVIVAQTIKPRFRIYFVGPSGRSTPVNQQVKSSTQIKSSILIGFLITVGTFNRPTFPCFAIVPALYWASESLKRNSYNFNLALQRMFVPIALTSSITAILISGFDTFYYTGLDTFTRLAVLVSSLDFVEFFKEVCNHWILTPYNFIIFNSNADNLVRFGLHLPFTHFLVNIPLAFNILGLMFYEKLINLLVGSGAYRLLFSTQRIYGLMLLTALTSTILLSFIPHQEFRFLMPLIIPMVYMFGFNVYKSNKCLSFWLLSNFLLIYFYSCIHQSAVTRSCLDLSPVLKSYQIQSKSLIQVNVIAYHCYSTPSYLWNIPFEDHRFNLDLIETEEDLSLKLERVITKQRQNPLYSHKLYVMLPRLYEENLVKTLQTNFSIELPKIFSLKNYTHFSGEEFENSINYIATNGLKFWKEAFGFNLLQVDLNS